MKILTHHHIKQISAGNALSRLTLQTIRQHVSPLCRLGMDLHALRAESLEGTKYNFLGCTASDTLYIIASTSGYNLTDK